jgi:hypothetical protein
MEELQVLVDFIPLQEVLQEMTVVALILRLVAQVVEVIFL